MHHEICGSEMSVRSLATRLTKLEEVRRRPDELLLVWRKPDSDAAAGGANAEYAPGDKVISAEWFGEGPIPAPNWYAGRLSTNLDRVEYEYITRSLTRLVAASPECDPRSNFHLAELSDNELLYMALGVET
jgi:hypothetical protein